MPPKISQHRVDACVVSYNTKDLTLSTLRSLRATTTTIPTNYMVVDNASEDGSAEALIDFSRRNPVTVIRSHENLGYGKALNKAFALGDAEYLLALNSDLNFPDAGWLEQLVQYMDDHPEVGCVSPLLLDRENRIGGAGVIGTVRSRKIRWWREPYDKHRDKLQEPKECISVCGACMLIRRTAFEDCKGFDENFPFYFEETSLHRLMRVFNWKIMFYPKVKVIHYWNKSPSKEKSKWFREGEKYFDHIWGDKEVISDD